MPQVFSRNSKHFVRFLRMKIAMIEQRWARQQLLTANTKNYLFCDRLWNAAVTYIQRMSPKQGQSHCLIFIQRKCTGYGVMRRPFSVSTARPQFNATVVEWNQEEAESSKMWVRNVRYSKAMNWIILSPLLTLELRCFHGRHCFVYYASFRTLCLIPRQPSPWLLSWCWIEFNQAPLYR